MKYNLIEPACGSAALTLHLLGAKRSVLSYQGNKWRYRKKIASIIEKEGFSGVKSVHLNDIGPWGRAWFVLHHPLYLQMCISELKALVDRDPREVFLELNGAPVPEPDHLYAAQYLFLQRLSHSGKAVGTSNGKWKSPGFNKTSAYGTEKTSRFGAVKPLIPSLIRSLEQLVGLEWPNRHATQTSQYDMRVFLDMEYRGPTVAYIDPPYSSTTRYPDGHIKTEGVVEVALEMHRKGVFVLVSEAKPVEELVERGWRIACIKEPTSDAKPFHSKKSEYITLSPPRS